VDAWAEAGQDLSTEEDVPMRFVYQFPDAHGTQIDMLDAGAVDWVAVTAERAGFLGFSFTEHPIPASHWLERGGHQTFDPFVALGHVAAVTRLMRLLSYLAVAPYRNPSLLAKAAATVDRLSEGRFILGMGTGYQESEFGALGVDFDERNSLFDEMLRALPLHWRGGRSASKADTSMPKEVMARPRPIQDPIPVWIGGNSRLARRRVIEKGHGWMPLLGPPALSVRARTAALSSLEAVADAIAEMRSAPDRPFEVLYPYIDPTIRSPTDDIDRHREAFASIEQAGATWTLIISRSSSPNETFEFLDGFGSTYIG
jgi:probable F420-dependent oxidoreductase